MLRAEVNWNTCRMCDPCSARLACKTKAVIKVDADEPARIDLARCNGCGECCAACPYTAIALKNVYVSNTSGARTDPA